MNSLILQKTDLILDESIDSIDSKDVAQEKLAINNPVNCIGSIDSVNDGILRGWAFSRIDPDTHLLLEVIADSRVVGEGTAKLLRADLEKEKIGRGDHGFEILLDEAILDGFERSLTLRVKVSGIQVRCEPFTLKQDARGQGQITGIKDSQLVGFFDINHLIDIDTLALQLLVDGLAIPVTSAAQRQGNQKRFHFSIPIAADYFDGEPHLYTIILGQSNGLRAHYIDILQPILTPWQYLKSSYQHLNYSLLSRAVGHRYESLRKRLDRAITLNDMASLDNIHTAHEMVVEGYEDRKRFPLLKLPAVAKPKVSIVIPVHNKFALTYHCIASLILADNNATYEVIVVDDCSTDETTGITDVIENIHVIVNKENLGFLRNCNLAAKQAQGEYVVLLNNDTEVTSGWLDEMLDTFSRFDGVGLVGSKLLYPDGRLQEAGGIVWGSGEPWNLGNGANPAHPIYSYTRQVDYVSGASLMTPKALWDELGGLSEEFIPAYYEDTDFAFKVRQAGYKTVYCPFSEVIHFEGMSNGRDLSVGIKKYQAVNTPKFRSKWIDAYRHNGKTGENLRLNMDRNVHYRVLVIDYATPRPDHDAGSYAAIQEMRLLQALGCKVTFAPNNFAHMGKYTDELQRSGIECMHAPFYVSMQQILEERGQDYDLVYITRYDIAEQYVDMIRQHSRAKIMFNNADLHFLRELRASLVAGHDDLSGPLTTRDRELALMRQVDVILSYNPTEHAVILSHNLKDKNIFRCPWVLDSAGHKTPFAERKGVSFLGGYRHAPNVEAVEYFVAKVMPLLRKRVPGITFHIFGSSVPDSFKALACDDVIIEGFVESLDDVFEATRVFVAPLQSGAGIKGKVLDCIAYGMPSVLTDVAAEATGLTHGINTMIAESPEEWVDAIEQLYTDEAMWNTHAQSALLLAKGHYSFEQGLKMMRRPMEYLHVFPPKKTMSLF